MATLIRLFIAVLIIHCGALSPALGSGGREAGRVHVAIAVTDSRPQPNAAPIDDLSIDERWSVDERFANGLIFFYDGDYTAALDVFTELQRVVDSDRLLYLSATCRNQLGDRRSARKALGSLLEKNPDHHEARVALMEWYAHSGDNIAAAQQMQYLEERPLEDDHRMLLDQLKRRIDQQWEKSRHYLSIAQSLRWDSNINAGPDQSKITAPDGTVLVLDEEERAISDWGSTTHLYGWYRHDPASFMTLFWDTSVSLYHLHYFEHREYNYTDLSLSTGPVWKDAAYYLGLPVGYRTSMENGVAYSNDIYIQPVFTYSLNNQWAVKSSLYYGDRSHADSADEALDKIIRRIDLQPIFTTHTTSISAGVGWLSASAHDPFFSYQGVEASLNASHEWTDRTTMSVGYKHRRTQYRGAYTGWFEKREDETNSIHASVTHEMGKHWAWDASTSWSNNHSNTELFDYERLTAGLKVILNF